jgi:hypothetical protein
MIQERLRAGLTRLRDAGKRLGWPPIAPALEKRIREALATPVRPVVRPLGLASILVKSSVRSSRRPVEIWLDADDLPAAFDAAAKEHAEALLTTAESIFVAQRARMAELAARYKLPAMYCYSTNVVDVGGLMAYDVSYPDLIRRAASYVDRILK